MIVATFAAVYAVWGSTYLAIRVVVESMPPFLAGAVRFIVAGVALLGLSGIFWYLVFTEG